MTKKTEQPITLILLGEPASGKGTQAKLLLKKYKLVDAETGEFLRRLSFNKRSQASILDKTLNKGKLVPSSLVLTYWKDKLDSLTQNQGIVFTGSPKKLLEAHKLVRLLKKANRGRCLVIYVTLPLAEVKKREAKRTEIYRGTVRTRADDSAEALANRLKYYKVNVSATVKYLKLHFPFKVVSGVGSRTEVHQKLLKVIDRFINDTANEIQ